MKQASTTPSPLCRPVIANIFLHHVLDEWYVKQAKPRLTGRSFLVRFADDFVLGCENEVDGQRLMKVLPKRFEKYGLTIHPEKSKMISFKWPSKFSAKSGNGTFDFLGFTHYWGKSRNGNWVIKRQTSRKRQRHAMCNLYLYCRNNKHEPVKEQFRQLNAKLLGALGQSRLASNVNQLAKAVNTGSLQVNDEVQKAILDACRSIQWMRDMFSELMQGVEDLKKSREGKLTLRTTTLEEKPRIQISADEIVNLRKRLNMSRPVFAAMLRTSPRTLER